jgi:hypothetical protein
MPNLSIQLSNSPQKRIFFGREKKKKRKKRKKEKRKKKKEFLSPLFSELLSLTNLLRMCYVQSCERSAVLDPTTASIARDTVPVEVIDVVDHSFSNTFWDLLNGGEQMTGRSFVAFARPQKTILVFFRGTVQDRVESSLRLKRKRFHGLKVHQGYLSHYRKLRVKTLAAIREALRRCPECTDIHVSGFSMGGALATIAMIELQIEFPQLCASITTFGSPRVGGKRFAKEQFPRLVCGESRRITHRADQVVDLPPRWMGYRHVGMEWWNGDFYANILPSDFVMPCDSSMNKPDGEKCLRSMPNLTLDDHRGYLGIQFDPKHDC